VLAPPAPVKISACGAAGSALVAQATFLAARMREEARHLGTRPGTLRGLSVTGGVITAAGVVLAATFAALVLEPTVCLTEAGTAVAIGVLLDTLLVRTVLVPAALLTIGERVWWPTRPGREAAAVPAGRDPVKI
jgi:putative drug exporter of the RND superfamily